MFASLEFENFPDIPFEFHNSVKEINLTAVNVYASFQNLKFSDAWCLFWNDRKRQYAHLVPASEAEISKLMGLVIQDNLTYSNYQTSVILNEPISNWRYQVLHVSL